MEDATTETCARALIRHWISRFGVPDTIQSDRGPQFTSKLWAALNKLVGISASTTTAYHPQANGMVERFHRQLKASLKARLTSPNWMDELPLVLLGIRATWREDADCSVADLVYGTSLHIPGEFIPSSKAHSPQPTEFLQHLQDIMRSALPVPVKFHGKHPTFIPKDLAKTGFVYVRHDAHRGQLQRPYKGPFKILKTADKFFTLDINGSPDTVSIDRLKVAYPNNDTQSPVPSPTPTPLLQPTLTPPKSNSKAPSPKDNSPVPLPTSRSGRQIRRPLRYSN